MNKYYLSIDIGGTDIKYALIDKAGNIFQKGKTKTPTTSLLAFQKSINHIITQFSPHIRGVAFSIPGKTDNQSGIVYHGGSLPFLDHVNFRQLFGKPYDLPISIENDGKSAALAELWLGNLKNVDSGVAIVLGTGIGGGIILNHQLYYGSNLMAGEFSFVASNYSNGDYLDNSIGLDLSAVQMVNKIGNKLRLKNPTDGPTVFQYINQNDSRIGSIFIDYCSHVAKLILSLQAVLDVNRFVIGGGISAQSIVTNTIRKELGVLFKENKLVYNTIGDIDIQQAKFGSDANLFGALYSFLLQIDSKNSRRSIL
ncbi:ROK family protein [Pediococcus siamensis]|uniref:ROK family protein n=1 Tax=Pediococcus siamensis TaxID=381829 RepID=UPI0039A312F4